MECSIRKKAESWANKSKVRDFRSRLGTLGQEVKHKKEWGVVPSRSSPLLAMTPSIYLTGRGVGCHFNLVLGPFWVDFLENAEILCGGKTSGEVSSLFSPSTLWV